MSGSTTNFTQLFACHVDQLADGESLTVDGPLEAIAVFRVDGEFFATSDSCTHERWSLGEEGELEGHEVLCSLHMARFDVRTGSPLCYPAIVGLRSYKSVVENDDVFVLIPE